MDGTTTTAHTGYLLQLVHEIEALVGLLIVKVVDVERLKKEHQIRANLKSIHTE